MIRIGKIYTKNTYRLRIIDALSKYCDTSKTLADIIAMLPIGVVVLSEKGNVDCCSNELLNILNIGKDITLVNDFIAENKLLEKQNCCIKIKEKSYLVNNKQTSNKSTIISLTDITEVNELNKLKHESLIKTNLMQTLRHEIRTPLTGIIGLITSLKKTINNTLNDDLKQLVSATIYSCNMISNMLNNFTAYSESNFEFKPEDKTFNLSKFLKSISKLITHQANIKQIEFNIAQHDIPRYIVVDDLKYQQLFLNILTNSIKYTFNGTINVLVECTQNQIVTKVVDTGIGIHANMLSSIFKLFNDPESKLLEASTGIGLGLYISKKIAEAMGGKIVISSVEGKGTEVIFTVRYTPVQNNTDSIENFNEEIDETINVEIISPKILHSVTSVEQFRKQNGTVLIVDDTVFNVYAIKSMLKVLKVPNILEAFNGKQAVEAVKKSCRIISLILMDLNMPEKNGFEATVEINIFLAENKLKLIPIIALSAQMDDGYLKRAKSSGMVGYSTFIISNEAD